MLSTFETNMDQGLEHTNLGYSTKNIPIPNKKEYLKCLIDKAEKFMRNIRWRTFFFLNPDMSAENKETYGFRSTKSPPQIPELKEFEDGMLNIVQKIEFKNTSKPFQQKLSNDTETIKKKVTNYLLLRTKQLTSINSIRTSTRN